jgi:hypothetical protein
MPIQADPASMGELDGVSLPGTLAPALRICQLKRSRCPGRDVSRSEVVHATGTRPARHARSRRRPQR